MAAKVPIVSALLSCVEELLEDRLDCLMYPVKDAAISIILVNWLLERFPNRVSIGFHIYFRCGYDRACVRESV